MSSSFYHFISSFDHFIISFTTSRFAPSQKGVGGRRRGTIKRGLGTESAKLGTFKGLGTESARLGTFRSFGTERVRLDIFRGFGPERTLRGFGTERARLGPFRGKFTYREDIKEKETQMGPHRSSTALGYREGLPDLMKNRRNLKKKSIKSELFILFFFIFGGYDNLKF